MSLASEINADLQVIENDLEYPTFTWAGQADPFITGSNFSCIAGSASHIAILTEGGFQSNLDIVLTVRQELFSGNFPLNQQRVKYRNEGYRIWEVRKDVTSQYLRLFLINDSKGI